MRPRPLRVGASALLPAVLVALAQASASPAADRAPCALPAPASAPCAPMGPRDASLNVTEPPYSADPTMQADASTAIQAAVDALAARCGPTGPGGEIVLPPGRYLVARPIVLPYQRRLGGAISVRGAGATLVNAIPPGAGSQAIFVRPPLPDREPIGADGWSFEGLAFEGRNCPGSKGMEIHGAHRVVVRRCSFADLDVGLELRFCLAAAVEQCVFTLCRSHGLVLGDTTWTGRPAREFYGCNAAVVRGCVHYPCGADPGNTHCRGRASRSAVLVDDSASVVVEDNVFNGPRPFHVIEHLVTTSPAPDNNVKQLEVRRTWLEFYSSPPRAADMEWPEGHGLPAGEEPLPSYVRTNSNGHVVIDGAFVQDIDPSCARDAPAGRCVERLFLDARSVQAGGRFELANVVGVPREMKFGVGASHALRFDDFAGLFDEVPCGAGKCRRENVAERLVGRGRPAWAVDEAVILSRQAVELETLVNGRNDLPFLQLGVSGTRTVAHLAADEILFHATPEDAGSMTSAPVLGRVGAYGWRFQRDVDLAGNRLLGAAIDPRTGPPPDPRPGQLWFEVKANRFEYLGSDGKVHALLGK